MVFVQTSLEVTCWVIDEFLAWNSIQGLTRINNSVHVNAWGHWKYKVIRPKILNESKICWFHNTCLYMYMIFVEKTVNVYNLK